MIAYKVVSLLNNTPDMHSFTRPWDLDLIYRVGETTVPKVGKIFVFKTYWEAKAFVAVDLGDMPSGVAILEGEAEDMEEANIMCCNIYYGLRQWWIDYNEDRQGVRYQIPPHGSYWCSTFTPTKIICSDPHWSPE